MARSAPSSFCYKSRARDARAGSEGKSGLVAQQCRENHVCLSKGPDMGESSASQDQKDRNVPHEIRSESPT